MDIVLHTCKKFKSFRCLVKNTFLISCVIFFMSINVYGENTKLDFDIPAQDISSALNAYAQKTDLSLIYKLEDIGNTMSKGISGKYFAIEALKVMLDGTGLVFEQKSATTIGIKKDFTLSQNDPQLKSEVSENPKTEQDKSLVSNGQSKEELNSDYMLEDTVVTASMRDVTVQDIPMSIQALKGDHLEKVGATELEDFVNRVPGLTLNSGGLGMNSLQIRGVASFNNSMNSTATVGYYIDDSPISDAMMAPDAVLFDLERVEVLKGPQGTLYGEGSLGGTIRLINRKPNLNGFESKIQLTTSKTKNSPGFNYKTDAVVNVPMIKDQLALRVSGSFISDDGFVDEVNSGEEGTNSFDKGAFRAAIWYDVNDELSIYPTVIYQKTDAGSGSYDSSLLADLTWSNDMPYNEWFKDEFTLLALTINYDLNWAELSSNISYYDRENTSVTDYSHYNPTLSYFLSTIGGDPSPFLRQDSIAETQTFSEELRLVSKGDGPFTWLVGAFYRERKINFQWLLENDQLLEAVGNATFFNNEGGQTAKQIALFTDFEYSILDNLKVNGGLRWFQEKIDGDYLFEINFATFPNLAGGSMESSLTEEDLLFKAGISGSLTPNLMLFAQFTQGIRPGGANDRAVDIGAGAMAPNFLSDSTDNYEVGVKSDWFDGRFRANASLYYIDWKDIQVVDYGLPGQTYIFNAAKAISKGIDIELSVQPQHGLILGLNVGYNIAETEGETDTVIGPIQDGVTLSFSPKLSSSAFVDYTFPISDRLLGYVGADIQYLDEQYSTVRVGTTPLTPLEAYSTINMRVGLTIDDSWKFQIFATNVTDERAEVNLSVIQPHKGFMRNRPRTIGLQMTKTF